jgi:hypothetical protein
MIEYDYKLCNDCNTIKILDDFHKKLDGKANCCKSCTSIKNKIYRQKHKNELSSYRKEYYSSHKEELIIYGREYRDDLENKKKISLYKKDYYEQNKQDICLIRNKQRKIRRQTDPSYRLRALVSKTIHRMLKNNLSSKNGVSIKCKLQYSIEELKLHLESLFEPWMTWKNHGAYNAKKWNDDDQSTWTWQIDHIIPQSNLPYTSMEDDNFKLSWALENLRPLNAKINIIEGCSRTRHKNNNLRGA